MGCKYCGRDGKIVPLVAYQTHGGMGIQAFVSDGWLEVELTDEEAGDSFEVREDVAFCPVCGEEF